MSRKVGMTFTLSIEQMQKLEKIAEISGEKMSHIVGELIEDKWAKKYEGKVLNGK